MRPLLLLVLATAAGPVMAQTPTPYRQPEGVRIFSPAEFGVTAETPSRIPSSREAMNYGRNRRGTPQPTPAARDLAAAVVARAGLVCSIAEAAVVGRTRDGGDLIEIDCVEGGGVIVADTDPVQVVDCLDLAPDEGQAGRRQRVITACQLPGNAGLAEEGQAGRD